MIRRQLNRARFTLTLVIYCVPLLAFAAAGYLRFAGAILHFSSYDAEPSPYFGLLLFTTFVWAVAAENYGLTSVELLFASGGKLRRISLAVLTTCVIVLATTFFYRDTTFSRWFIWMSAANLLAFTAVLQTLLRVRWSGSARTPEGLVHLLIVGADEFAARISESFRAGQIMPCTVVAHVRLPDQACQVRNCPILELDDVAKLAPGRGIDDVVIALPPERMGQLPALVRRLECLSVPVRAVFEVGESVAVRERLFNLGGVVLLDLQPTPAESILYLSLKRLFDFSFSLLVLMLTAPLAAVITAAIRLTSRGPAIFVQERVGLNGKIFSMYKFRTMTLAPRKETDLRWTVPDDPRCTRVGKLLRRTGLDELPQFLNVLKGEMSVVGPRPERPLLVQKFMHSIGNYNTRHHLKVGITGWAQVNGWRGDTSIEKRVEYDLYYLRHWTLSFDLLIVILTLVRGFSGKNAY
jgi:Undecaprenyl-phosphate glucose phosphotransferase